MPADFCERRGAQSLVESLECVKPLLLGESLSQTARPMADSPQDLPDLPEVEAADPEPVAVAIETARALFRSDERLEALRWLRRAAERAEESGDDLRALNLARSAADLSTALQSLPPPPTSPASVPPPAAPPLAPAPVQRVSAPPPAPPAPRSPAPPPAPPPPVLAAQAAPTQAAPPPDPPATPSPQAAPTQAPPTPRRVDEAVALSPYDDFSDKTQVDAKAPLQRDALQSGVQITEMPKPVDAAPRSVTMPSPPSSEQTIADAQFTPVVEVKQPALRSAVRVAVTRDPSSPDIWLVRPLAEDAKLPPGCEEALLVALDPKSRLLQ